MPRYRDHVYDTTTSTGPVNFTLSGTAPAPYRPFYPAYPLGEPMTVCIQDKTGGLWVSGIAYLTSSTTLVLDTIFEGSNGEGAPVTFTTATKDIFVTLSSHTIADSNSGAMLARINGLAMP